MVDWIDKTVITARPTTITVVISLLLCTLQPIASHQTVRVSVSNKATADALNEFSSSIASSASAKIWVERGQNVYPAPPEQIRRHLLSTISTTEDSLSSPSNTSTTTASGGVSAASHLALRGWELILDAGNAVRNVVDAKRIRVQEFLAEILGRDWSDFTPHSWLSHTFDWDALSNFDIHSNLQDLLSNDVIQNLQMPQSLSSLKAKFDAAVDAFCDLPELLYQTPLKVPTTCYGPNVTISFVPKICVLNQDTRQIVCSPAYLVVKKTPAVCVLKHFTPFTWTGKQCRHKVEIGLTKETIIGGEEYTIDFTDFLSDTFQAVKNHLLPDAPLSATVSEIPGQPLRLRVTWVPHENAGLQGVGKYLVKCVSGVTQANTRSIKTLFDVDEVIVGAATSGDNRELVPGLEYICSVAAVNAKGVGPAVAAPQTVTLPAATTVRYWPTADNFEANTWVVDRFKPATWIAHNDLYDRQNVVTVGIDEADFPDMPTYNKYHRFQGRKYVGQTPANESTRFVVTASVYIPEAYKNKFNRDDSSTFRDVSMWLLFSTSHTGFPLAGSVNGDDIDIGYKNVPAFNQDVNNPFNAASYSQFYTWSGYTADLVNIPVASVPVRYNRWNDFAIDYTWIQSTGAVTVTNYINNVNVGTNTYNAWAPNIPAVYPMVLLQTNNPCASSDATDFNPEVCTNPANLVPGESCCKGATYSVNWSNVKILSSPLSPP